MINAKSLKDLDIVLLNDFDISKMILSMDLNECYTTECFSKRCRFVNYKMNK